MKVQLIRSPKHPGAVFVKVKGTEDEFICKFYKGYSMLAQMFKVWIELDPEHIFEQGIKDVRVEERPERGSLTL